MSATINHAYNQSSFMRVSFARDSLLVIKLQYSQSSRIYRQPGLVNTWIHEVEITITHLKLDLCTGKQPEGILKNSHSAVS